MYKLIPIVLLTFFFSNTVLAQDKKGYEVSANEIKSSAEAILKDFTPERIQKMKRKDRLVANQVHKLLEEAARIDKLTKKELNTLVSKSRKAIWPNDQCYRDFNFCINNLPPPGSRWHNFDAVKCWMDYTSCESVRWH